ncbi:MAG: adenylosuccinate synthetase, partial [Ilumatobacteraceae bacterium]
VTGRRRRPGWIDCVMLRHAVRVNSLTELALTKLDVLDTFDEVKICTGYRIDGDEYQGYPDRIDLLDRVEPVYETIEGWTTSLAECRRPDELPLAARRFVETVEREVGVPVRIIGVGAERDAVVEWDSGLVAP